MTERQRDRPSALVFGARNLGRAIIERLVEQGWAARGEGGARGQVLKVAV